MCRCAERRAALIAAGGAALRGDLTRVVPTTAFVVKSSAEDLGAAFRSVVGALKRVGR